MNKQIDDGGLAFPCTPPDGNPNAYVMFPSGPGMSLRDWFAGQATEGDIDQHGDYYTAPGILVKVTREEAKYRYADAMLAARKEKQ
jgi:hypothetical protein